MGHGTLTNEIRKLKHKLDYADIVVSLSAKRDLVFDEDIEELRHRLYYI